MDKKKGVIFACIGNSCRSQMAEGFARKYFPPGVSITSAGTIPALEVNPNAIAVMAEVGIDISSNRPKVLSNTMFKDTSHFIGMGCGVVDSCPVPLVQGAINIEDWGIQDPVGKDIDTFREVRDIIEEKVKALAQSFKGSSTGP